MNNCPTITEVVRLVACGVCIRLASQVTGVPRHVIMRPEYAELLAGARERFTRRMQKRIFQLRKAGKL